MNNIVRSSLAVAGRIMLAAVLLVAGLFTCLYSSWFQEKARVAAVNMLNSDPDTEFRLDSLSIRFPLKVNLAGLHLIEHGDTMMRAAHLDADVSLLPLLVGKVEISGARVKDGRYQTGTLDSATCIVVRANDIMLDPSSLTLSPMHINVSTARMSGGLVDIFINPVDTTPATTEPPTPLTIDASKIELTDFRMRMNMMPVIDSLGTYIASAELEGGLIDINRQLVDVKKFTGTGLDATYIVPDSAAIAATTVLTNPDKPESAPWTVKVRQIDFKNSSALYTTRGVTPMPGIDFAYISTSDMSLRVDSFYNCGPQVRIPLKISAHERCGVDLRLSGTVDITETMLNLEDMLLRTTEGTRLKAQALMGIGDITTDTSLPVGLRASGSLAPNDAAMMFTMLRPYTAGLINGTMIDADIDISGSMGHLDITRLNLDIPNSLNISASGNLSQVLKPGETGGHIKFKGTIGNLTPWRRLLASLQGFRIPPMALDGDITFRNGNYDGVLSAVTYGGSLALDGTFKGNSESYDLSLITDNFPVNAFMPAAGVGKLTATITATGHGFNFFSNKTTLDAYIDIAAIEYNKNVLTDIAADMTLADGNALLNAASKNHDADFTFSAQGNLTGDDYAWTASLDSRHFDFQALRITEAPLSVAGNLKLTATVNARHPGIFNARLEIPALSIVDSLSQLTLTEVDIHALADSAMTNVALSNRDLYAFFSMPLPPDSLSPRLDMLTAELRAQARERRINIEGLQRALPPFALDIEAGKENVLMSLLSQQGIDISRLNISAANDTVLSLNTKAQNLRMAQIMMDTLTFNVAQEGNRLNYTGALRNRPGTLDQCAAADIDGYFRPGQLGLNFAQRNIHGKTGFKFGAFIDLGRDTTATLHLSPLDPTIGYRQWTVNDDNFIKYNFATQHIDANIRMNSDESSLALYTEHATEHDGALHTSDEDIVLQLSDIKIQDWITLNPFAPPLKGLLSTDMRINYEHGNLAADGDITLTDLFYGRERVGTFKADVGLRTTASGVINADIGLDVGGTRALTLKGALNDSTRTSPFGLDLTMIHFPLSTLNAFLPGVARLSGSLNGNLDVSGTMSQPILDGALQFDSATVKVDMLGTVFKLSPTSIPVTNSKVTLSNFAITGCNDKPLTITGHADIRNLSDIGLDLSLNATEMQIVNSTRAAKGADVYGKAFISTATKVRGSTSLLIIDGSLTLNSGSNVTYVMADAENVIQSQHTSDMVRFVNFNDTTALLKADSLTTPSSLMIVNAMVNIQNGTTINVDLSANGKNKVQIGSQGALQYTRTPMDDGRLTGRLNINSGFVRYTPPLMSEKNFTFDPDSYIAFSGDMMNPSLNIHAVDHMRANVTQEGQNSRLIYFDISLDVTGTLENTNVVFDLATDDDVTIANELQSMSQTQRASQAMNLLLYNVYTGPGTKANANLSGSNPLYSFLTSQINTWMANTVKGIDVSFGVDQYDRTFDGSSSTTTSYSYRVSKSLFNDKVKIAVGGSYSDDPDENQNVAQNLFNDISIEYILNKQGTMYIKVFRHTGFESILEGEITQTGVGFVYKRKIRRIGDMFRFRRRRPQAPVMPIDPAPASPETAPSGFPVDLQDTSPQSLPVQETPTPSTTSKDDDDENK